MEEIPRSSGDDRNGKHDSGKRKTIDSEMLRTYSTGLLAVCLARYLYKLPFLHFLFVIFLFSSFFL